MFRLTCYTMQLDSFTLLCQLILRNYPAAGCMSLQSQVNVQSLAWNHLDSQRGNSCLPWFFFVSNSMIIKY